MGKSRLVAEFVRGAAREAASSRSASASRTARTPATSCGATSGATLFGLDHATPEPSSVGTLEAELAAIDPALVAARAAARPVCSTCDLPDNDLTRAVRRQAAQDVARGPARRVPARAGGTTAARASCSRTATGSTRSRAICSRSLARALAGAARAGRARLSAGRRTSAARSASSACRLRRRSRSPSSTRRDAGARSARGSSRSLGAEREVAGGARRARHRSARRATRSTSRSCSTTSAARGVDPHDERALGALELPDSLHSLILSRIDTLGEAPRRTLKVASVVGRVFRAPMLPGVYPELGDARRRRGAAARARAADLVSSTRRRERAVPLQARRDAGGCLREHAVRDSRDAARARRRRTSRRPSRTRSTATSTCSRTTSGTATNRGKKRDYLRRAGEAAQATYANAAAIDYFERWRRCWRASSRWHVPCAARRGARARGELATRRSRRPRSARRSPPRRETTAAPRGRKRRSPISRASAAIRRGAELAASGPRSVRCARRRVGPAASSTSRARSPPTQGDFAAARERSRRASRSAVSSTTRQRWGALLSNLGIMAEYDGDYDRSRALHEQGLAYRIEAGDKGAVAISR